MALRIDSSGTLAKPVKLPNGFMRVDAMLTRTGVFEYRNPDGTPRRELRLAEEVFKRDSLQSFGLLPVTDNHPPTYLTAKNAKDFQRGALGETVRRDGDFVAASMLVTDAELIAKMESGEQQEVSCGYFCDLEERGGVHEGEHYDAIQRNIRGNHVAIVQHGRAGEAARVRMDEALSGVILISENPKPEEHTLKIRIDGVEYEGDSAAQAFARFEAKIAGEQKAAQAKNDAQAAELQKLQARADSSAEKVTELEKKLAEAPKAIAAQLQLRADLESRARTVLGSKVKFDGLTDEAIRAKVVLKLKPEAKLEGKTAEYLTARFDAAVEEFDPEAVVAAQSKVREELEVEHADGEDAEVAEENPTKLAEEAMRKDARDAWKKNIAKAP